MRTHSRGFSLIELLIVVAVILIIAAIAIPNLIRSRIAANQASAVESCRMINTTEMAYAVTYGVGFTSTLAQLGPPASGQLAGPSAAGLLDSILASGLKSGYQFSYSVGSVDPHGAYQSYAVHASPISPSITGSAHYYTDQTHVIRANTSQTASAADSAVAQ